MPSAPNRGIKIAQFNRVIEISVSMVMKIWEL